jgi:hypothetical protein
MIQPNYKEGRTKVTEEIKREVSRLVDQEKDWENKKKHPSRWYRSETAKILGLDENSNPSLRSYEELVREIRNNARTQNPIDKPWNTALLNSEPINTEIIPWIVSAQFNRRLFLSKPLTIREVKWFIRFFGFRNHIKPLQEFNDNESIKHFFISNTLATWSQIYADREKIDFIAGIQDADYSDLDIAMVNNNIRLGAIHTDGKMKDRTLRMKAAEAEIPEREYIVYSESDYLHHSLGEPSMSHQSCHAYNIMMSHASVNYSEKLRAIPYLHKINFFILMRNFCKDRTLDEVIDFTMSKNQWWEDAFAKSEQEDVISLHTTMLLENSHYEESENER